MNQHKSAQSPGAVLHALVCTPPPQEGHPGVAASGGFLQRICSVRFSPSCTRMLLLRLVLFADHNWDRFVSPDLLNTRALCQVFFPWK